MMRTIRAFFGGIVSALVTMFLVALMNGAIPSVFPHAVVKGLHRLTIEDGVMYAFLVLVYGSMGAVGYVWLFPSKRTVLVGLFWGVVLWSASLLMYQLLTFGFILPSIATGIIVLSLVVHLIFGGVLGCFV